MPSHVNIPQTSEAYGVQAVLLSDWEAGAPDFLRSQLSLVVIGRPCCPWPWLRSRVRPISCDPSCLSLSLAFVHVVLGLGFGRGCARFLGIPVVPRCPWPLVAHMDTDPYLFGVTRWDNFDNLSVWGLLLGS